jgi:hypothetical protein
MCSGCVTGLKTAFYKINMKVENTGQIRLGQPFGEYIAKYAADSRFSRYVEIGTWNGRGSTCCFQDGFERRSTPATLQSYEISKSRVQEATELWKDAPHIHIVHGRVLEDNKCPTFSQVQSVFPKLTVAWHSEDVDNFWSASYVPMEDPEVVLLDGAEYLTYFEFEEMKRMTGIKVFMLDDSAVDKCRDIHRYLLANPDWTRVAYSDTDRNGWSIFERITDSSV